MSGSSTCIWIGSTSRRKHRSACCDLWLQRDTSVDSLASAIRTSRTWILLSVNRGPYDALKATGLDKVSNDRVRAALIETYDYRLPRTADFVAMSSAQFVGVDPLQDALFRPALENGPDRLPRITSIR